MANIKKIKRLRGGDLQVAAQANVQIDAEIGQKDHFWMETSSFLCRTCFHQMVRIPRNLMGKSSSLCSKRHPFAFLKDGGTTGAAVCRPE
ncbi:hypothetical protein [Desulfatiglans anilini]|uniref:hypothetical protein n=1 Tax=Desulfatiglans anilini TaxID=90728 RepID=UPI0003F9C9CA|nr:hypothetical protein [Desulfatiglans anilini]